MVTSHFVLDTTRDAIKLPMYWSTPPAINRFWKSYCIKKYPDILRMLLQIILSGFHGVLKRSKFV